MGSGLAPSARPGMTARLYAVVQPEVPGLVGSSARHQVMVMTTAAVAATRMAIAAVSTVMEVASVVISQSRRARKAPRWGGTVGIAGREIMECPPQRRRAGNAYGSKPLDWSPYSAAAARNAAISMMKAVANQSSSGERNEVIGSRRAGSGERT